jgi:hypothetical protein
LGELLFCFWLMYVLIYIKVYVLMHDVMCWCYICVGMDVFC